MNKPNFKKFALMGMAGGMLIASQSPIAADAASQAADASTTLYAGGCGGGKCGSSSCGSQNKNRSQSQQYYNTAYDDQQMQTSGSRVISESDLLNQLGSEGKTLYQNLSPEGKALALRLANQYPDKLQAIRMAAQQMAEKRAQMSGGRTIPQPQQYGSQPMQYDQQPQQPQYNKPSPPSSRY